MIIHLDKEQVRQERRRLLSDDVFVIFHDALRQFCREGYTMLAPAEIYLSAKSFASDVLQLPDILEGIEDEMDDIQDDAANEDEAMLVLMVASAVIFAAGKTYEHLDVKAIIMTIYKRLNDHPLFFQLLEICARKEEKKWMEGKRTNLLTCELNVMKADGTKASDVKDFLHPFLQQVCEYPPDTIEKVLIPLHDLNRQYEGELDKEVDLLRRKLGVNTPAPSTPSSFVVKEGKATTVITMIRDYQSGKSKPKDLAMPVRAAMDAGVIRRPTFNEYKAIDGLAIMTKTTFTDYMNPDNKPLHDLNRQYEGELDKEVDLLRRKLGVNTPAPSTPSSFVVKEGKATTVITMIRDYQSGKSKPKDLAMPVRAAMDAGVIRRPTFNEYKAIDGLAIMTKTTFTDYMNPDNKPYEKDMAYREMVNGFSRIV